MSFPLRAIREQMQSRGLGYYWVPSADEHFNECVPACWQRRAFLSGFTGSNGDLLVGMEGAWLWTDSRYFLQAEAQLNPAEIKLMRMGIDESLMAFVAANAEHKTVGFDAKLLSMDDHRRWQLLAERHGFSIVSKNDNLVDRIWNDRPALPNSVIHSHDLVYSGRPCEAKLTLLRDALRQRQCQATVLTMLDSIAWLVNLRGQDLPTSPKFIGFMIVSVSDAVLYVDVARLQKGVDSLLSDAGVQVRGMDEFEGDLADLSGPVSLDCKTTSHWLHSLIRAEVTVEACPIPLLKAVKNPVEQEGMREAHRRDAVAIIKLMVWLETHWQGLDEVGVAERLQAFRQMDPTYKGVSFATISAFGANSAVTHYNPSRPSALPLRDDSVLLLDMGAQYFCGTTDVTRVLHFGQPADGHIRHYTLVLKGHLAIRNAVFLHGTCGEHLDSLARMPLWKTYCHYGHGTGHGVGCYLDVHEGPQRLAPTLSGVPLLPGMVVSNEPGFYQSGQYGIRIENLLLVKQEADASQSVTGHGPFYGFEDLTLVPYNRALIDLGLLSRAEIEQINHYHQQVRESLVDDLPQQEQQWLVAMTEPL